MDALAKSLYQAIDGTTDSEHIFALLTNELHTHPVPLETALRRTLQILRDLVAAERTTISANIVISEGERLIAARFAQCKPSTLRLRSVQAIHRSIATV